jgi:hypothetical protein
MGPPSVAAVARTNTTVAAHSAGPLGQSQTQTQGLVKRAFDGMSPISCSFFLTTSIKKSVRKHAAIYFRAAIMPFVIPFAPMMES